MAHKFLKIDDDKIRARYCHDCCFFYLKALYSYIHVNERDFFQREGNYQHFELQVRMISMFLVVEHITFLLKHDIIRSFIPFHKLFKDRKCEI